MNSPTRQIAASKIEPVTRTFDRDLPELPWQVVLIRDGWRRLIVLTVIGCLLFLLLALLIPKKYEAVARLMPPDQTASNMGLMSSLLAQGGGSLAAFGDLLGTRTAGATVVGILNSRTIQDDLINQFDLRRVYGKKRYEDTRKVLQKRSSITEDKKSGIITIAIEDRSPQRAAQLAKAYVDDLNSKVVQLTTSSAHRERLFLETRIAEIKQQLDEATLRLSQFSSKNKTLDPQIQGKAMLDAASALQGQLIAAETEYSGLSQIYGPENYRVKAAAARVAELRSKLRTMSGTPAPASSNQSGSSHPEPYPSLEQLPLLGNTYFELSRTAKVQEAVYEALTKQYELAKVEEAKEIPSIKVLDEPVVPERWSFPPILLTTIAGALLSFCMAFAWLMACEVWTRLPHNHVAKVSVNELRASFRQGLRGPLNGVGQ